MPQLDSDAFTYSDGALATVSSGKWTKLSGFNDLQVLSNALSGGAGDKIDVIASWSGGDDQYSQILISAAGSDGGPTVRSDAVNNCYLLDCTSGTSSDTYKVVGGSFTVIDAANAAAGWANGDTAYIEVQGTQIITKRNGVNISNFANAVFSTGKPGVFISGVSLGLDTWSAGNFSASLTAAQELPAFLQAQLEPYGVQSV